MRTSTKTAKTRKTTAKGAEERIQIAHNSHATELDLAGMRLKALPESIGQLGELQKLRLDNNQLRTLPASIGALCNLSSLSILGNQLRKLPDSIGQLGKLRELSLNENLLKDLPASFEQLSALAQLRLTDNRFTVFPEPILSLVNLIHLDLWNNPLQAVSESIGELKQLRTLDLDGTRLLELPEIFGKLDRLLTLYLNNNKLRTLPESIACCKSLRTLWLQNNALRAIPGELALLAEAGELKELFLHANEGLGVPTEILGPTIQQILTLENQSLPKEKQIKAQDPRRIARYIRQLQAGPTRPLNEAKVLVVGPGGHGKSSLIEYLREGTFQKGKKTTEGIRVAPWVFPRTDDDPEIRLNVWDFGGQEIQHSTHEFFLTQRAVYLLVFQPRDDQATAQGLYYWLDLIHLIAPNAPVIVALTKQDEYEGHVNDAGDLKKLHPKLIDFIPISCEASHPTSKNALRLRQLVLDTVCKEMSHIRYKLPAAWMKVKEELERPRVEYLSYSGYQGLCKDANMTDPEDQRLLATFLNDLGTMLNYADRMPLEDTHILNPAWVTEGVYAVVLASELHRAEGVFDEDLLLSLLSNPKHNGKYPLEAQRFILQMMLSFHLCYELTHQAGNRQYLVPNALPANAPALADSALESPLNFQIQFPRILPSSVMSRFIVAMHSKRKADKRWRLGLRSEMQGHVYLVTAHPKEKRIRIAVAGAGPSRVRVLEVIRQHFAVICREKEGLGAREFTFPPGHPTAEPYPFDSLLEAERNLQSSIWLPGGIGNISVTEWLNGVTDPRARREIQKAIAEGAKGGNGDAHSSFTYIHKINMTGQHQKNVTVTARDISNAAIGMDQKMVDCLKMIQNTPDGEVRTALSELHGHVASLLASPEMKDVDTVKSDLETFAKEAVKAEPRRKWLELSGSGLIEAAKTVAVMSGPITATVHKILELFPG